MYVLILGILQEENKVVNRKNAASISFQFTKVRIKCLSLESKLETEVWVFKNYLENAGELTREEQIAFRIFLNQCIADYIKENPFESSVYYQKFKEHQGYKERSALIRTLRIQLEQGERVKGKLEQAETDLRKLERKFKREHREEIRAHLVHSDPFLNAIEATYGWCITVHKAVGMLFDEIILHPNQGESRGVQNEDYYRWVYSGVSTAREHILVHNPIEIDPFMDCQFDDQVDVAWEDKSSSKKTAIILEEYTVPDALSKYFVDNIHDNCKAVIGTLSEVLEQQGILLQKTQASGEYLTKAYYSLPESSATLLMVFSNNGKGEVTSIRAERNGDGVKEQLDAAVASLYTEEPEDILSWEGLEDFRKDTYQELAEKSEQNNWDLQWVATHSYQDVFNLATDKGKIQFSLVYNGKGMFSYIKVLKKSDTDMGIVLHEFLLDGN